MQASTMRMKWRFGIRDEQIEQWINDTNIFFVLALGRSGTMFLANLLNTAPGAFVVHEPVRTDFPAYSEAFHSEEKAGEYVQRFRKADIYLRGRSKAVRTYGEVNGLLRRHCNGLKQAFPNAAFIHLIRDGRDVVRSIMSRRTFRPGDLASSLIHPTEGDPWADQWPDMSRFERICWLWQVENDYLRHSVGKTVHFERVISEYEYFRERLLDSLDLDIPAHTWREAVRNPRNVAGRYRIPHWSSWAAKERETFETICGEEMAKNGYELDWHDAGSAS
jgi:hypothetical protein